MSYKVNKHMLEMKTHYLNELTNSPMTYATRANDGRYSSNIGHYHWSEANGGWQLHRISNEGGAITCPLSGGYDTKRHAFELIGAYITGIEFQQRLERTPKS